MFFCNYCSCESEKYQHIRLINRIYNEYMKRYNEFIKNPFYSVYITDYNKLTEEQKVEYMIEKRYQQQMLDKIVQH